MWRYRHPDFALFLLEELQKQQQGSIFCDTLLQTDGVSVPAHSCVLAALSPFFSKILSTSFATGRQSKYLSLDAVGSHALLKLVGFLYTGELELKGQCEYDEVMTAAHRLGLRNLIERKRVWVERGAVNMGRNEERDGLKEAGCGSLSAANQREETRGNRVSEASQATLNVSVPSQASASHHHKTRYNKNRRKTTCEKNPWQKIPPDAEQKENISGKDFRKLLASDVWHNSDGMDQKLRIKLKRRRGACWESSLLLSVQDESEQDRRCPDAQNCSSRVCPGQSLGTLTPPTDLQSDASTLTASSGPDQIPFSSSLDEANVSVSCPQAKEADGLISEVLEEMFMMGLNVLPEKTLIDQPEEHRSHSGQSSSDLHKKLGNLAKTTRNFFPEQRNAGEEHSSCHSQFRCSPQLNPKGLKAPDSAVVDVLSEDEISGLLTSVLDSGLGLQQCLSPLKSDNDVSIRKPLRASESSALGNEPPNLPLCLSASSVKLDFPLISMIPSVSLTETKKGRAKRKKTRKRLTTQKRSRKKRTQTISSNQKAVPGVKRRPNLGSSIVVDKPVKTQVCKSRVKRGCDGPPSLQKRVKLHDVKKPDTPATNSDTLSDHNFCEDVTETVSEFKPGQRSETKMHPGKNSETKESDGLIERSKGTFHLNNDSKKPTVLDFIFHQTLSSEFTTSFTDASFPPEGHQSKTSKKAVRNSELRNHHKEIKACNDANKTKTSGVTGSQKEDWKMTNKEEPSPLVIGEESVNVKEYDDKALQKEPPKDLLDQCVEASISSLRSECIMKDIMSFVCYMDLVASPSNSTSAASGPAQTLTEGTRQPKGLGENPERSEAGNFSDVTSLDVGFSKEDLPAECADDAQILHWVDDCLVKDERESPVDLCKESVDIDGLFSNEVLEDILISLAESSSSDMDAFDVENSPQGSEKVSGQTLMEEELALTERSKNALSFQTDDQPKTWSSSEQDAFVDLVKAEENESEEDEVIDVDSAESPSAFLPTRQIQMLSTDILQEQIVNVDSSEEEEVDVTGEETE